MRSTWIRSFRRARRSRPRRRVDGAGRSRSRRTPPKEVGRGCPPERAQDGEVRLVFLGDSGYGQGFSEWGTQGQDAIAARLAQPEAAARPGVLPGRQHLLARQRRPLQDALRRRLRAAHPRLQGPRGPRQPRPQGLPGRSRSTSAGSRACRSCAARWWRDRKARYIRQGLDEAQAAEKAEADTKAESAGELAAEAIKTLRGNCLPGDATAYENAIKEQAGLQSPRRRSRTRSSASAASRRATRPRGCGSATTASSGRCRSSRRRGPSHPARGPSDAAARRRDGARLEHAGTSTAACSAGGPAAQGRAAAALAAQRHVAVAARAGRIAPHLEDHGDAPPAAHATVLRLPAVRQVHRRPRRRSWGCASSSTSTIEDLEPPDLVFAAHNHIYARSHPLDRSGKPVDERQGWRALLRDRRRRRAPLRRPRRRPALPEDAHDLSLRLPAADRLRRVLLDDRRRRPRSRLRLLREGLERRPSRCAANFDYDDSLPPRCSTEAG